ncbi:MULTISPECIES: ATP-binding protein [unclassified Agrococcus]|uniref:ATP-binding protein n=1 Tax=unclassified Agrococcus TaxID=2615065 RepID=UPI00360A4EED
MADQQLLMQAASWTPEQKALYTEVARVVQARSPRGRRIVAVDGRDGVGKTHLADALHVAFARAGVQSFRASLDDFQQPRERRHRQGRDSWKGRYEDAFDLELVDRVLLQPFRMGGSTGFMTRAFDVETDTPVEMDWRTAGPDAVLILDGVFLLRPAFRGRWHFVVRLEASDAERGARLQRRDGAHPLVSHSSHDRDRLAHEHYEALADPVRAADMVIDTTDVRAPRQVFQDRC